MYLTKISYFFNRKDGVKLKKRYLLAGSAGMLGNDIYQVFNKRNECLVGDIDDQDQHVQFLDFRDYDKYFNFVVSYKPDYLCHIGAYTDLEYCHDNISDAYDTNTKSVEHAVHIANHLNIPLIYISTAGIFNGDYDEYSDFDIPNPLGIYAKSKFYGERIIQQHSKEYLICRAGWMMGGGPNKDKKFIGKLLKQVIQGKREWKIVNDKFGTPTYTKDFSLNLLTLIQEKQSGIFNMVCQGNTSRLDVAEFLRDQIMEKYGIYIDITVVNSEFFSKDYYSPRPDNEALLNLRLNYKNLNLMRPWREALQEYLNDWELQKKI